ncbi:hypothetical protein LPJ78_001425 [Coemansia sp. RSA 989]|nr:hypothetical protein LPJ79_001441 [Coemansia sp. RSA 1821]KAJ1866888.1 hypothetical protein LPJ78_001425 [Coemansia sp. RSA 989]KAJ1874243.1 hypothetical protein LPJ55_001616 [Coemansia sp. RSA 990]KAJ2632355.1 hypothetical protein H4R22_001316 [Coemansia sp. RSA 1290]KAJ2651103.1 hypothetical protein IWW40_001871 [Coemansia sp. RSA 1250]KAJ2672940.1 hypothetical protein IWW42_002487 [Coemansia sp. RSA 1085]
MSGSTGKKGKKTYYKRVHENEPPENEDSSPKTTFYCAAAEDDHLGWSQENAVFDPMYTVNRRNRESDLASKDSFFKKLKSRLASDLSESKDIGEAPSNDVVSSQSNLSSSMAMLGFGVMSSDFSGIQDEPPSKPKRKKSKKSKKSKKQ